MNKNRSRQMSGPAVLIKLIIWALQLGPCGTVRQIVYKTLESLFFDEEMGSGHAVEQEMDIR